MPTRKRKRRLWDAYTFAGFRPEATVRGVFGDPKARVITLNRRAKKPSVALRQDARGMVRPTPTARARPLLRHTRVYLDIEVRRVACRRCGQVKREQLDFLADNPLYTKRFAFYVGRRCVSATIKDVAKELKLDWHTVKELEKQYMAEQLKHAGHPAPRAIGIDEISIRKGHTYRIVVSDLVRGRPIWFGGKDRSEASMREFYDWLGKNKAQHIRLAVMDMWKPFRYMTNERAPQAAILFDKFHVLRHLGEALDQVRKTEYARLTGKARRYIKGQTYTLLSHRENLTLDGRKALKTLLAANKRLNTAYLLKESFGQLWSYEREGLGTALLRELVRRPQVAAPGTLREVRRDD